MSEIKFVVDGLSASDRRQLQNQPSPTPAPSAALSRMQHVKRLPGRFANWLRSDTEDKRPRIVYRQPLDHLREQELFLDEITKELRELQASVDELTGAIKKR